MNGRGWKALIAERFPPASYGPLVVVFCLANVTRSFDASASRPGLASMALSLVIALSLFLRLRLFDELKDLDTDRAVNPDRPLARGAISPDEVKGGLFALVVLEGLLFACWAPAALGYWWASLAYSLLMYNEFFLSKFLRPRLTLYAITHTFVSVLMGAALWAFARGTALPADREVAAFFVANYFLFNLFEFARKSFAPSEERAHVESYTKNFGIAGAVVLSVSQALLFAATTYRSPLVLAVNLGLSGLYAVMGLPFIFRPRPPSARLFRNATGVFLLLFYVWTTIANFLRI